MRFLTSSQRLPLTSTATSGLAHAVVLVVMGTWFGTHSIWYYPPPYGEAAIVLVATNPAVPEAADSAADRVEITDAAATSQHDADAQTHPRSRPLDALDGTLPAIDVSPLAIEESTARPRRSASATNDSSATTPLVRDPLPQTMPRTDAQPWPPGTTILVAGTAGQSRLSPPQVVYNPTPEYPVESFQAGREGVVRILVQLTADGTVAEAVVADGSGDELLDQAALRAVRHWRFASETTAASLRRFLVPIRFRIERQP